MIDRTKQTAAKSARNSKTSNNLTARPSRMALAVSMALMAPAAMQVAYAGVGTVCTDGSTPTSSDPAARACATGTAIGTYYANSPLLKKFVDTLPGLTPGNANTFASSGKTGEYIPIAVADTAKYPGSEYFIIGVVEHKQWMHSGLQKETTQRSYVQLYPKISERPVVNGVANTNPPTRAVDSLTHQFLPDPVQLFYPDGTPITWPGTNGEPVYGYDNPHYLGPIILTLTGVPVRTQMVNFLPTERATLDTSGKVALNGRKGDMFLPVDETLAGAGLTPAGDKYPQNRVAFHLHGGDSPWISDGTPHQWVTAVGDTSPYKAGNRFMNAPDMPFPGDGAQNIFWPNDQSSRLMWYHDHTFGLTRQNAYAGAAAGYVIIDAAELALLGLDATAPTATPTNGPRTINGQPISKALPNGLLDQIVLVIQDKTFVPNDIAIQDSKWDINAWGQPGDLWYPHVYEPFQLWGTSPDATLDSATITGNPAGRWDYAVNDSTLMYLPPTVPLRNDTDYGDVAFPDGSYADGTAGKGPSATPESYMDTPVVNGVAYPTMTVEPKAYRVRFLNGANDRYWNLSLFVADPSVTSSDGRPNTEVKMVTEVVGVNGISLDIVNKQVSGGSGYTNPRVTISDVLADGTSGPGTGATASATVDPKTGAITYLSLDTRGSGYVNPQVIITDFAADGVNPGTGSGAFASAFTVPRPEGVPDPLTAGPSIIQFANEAGFLPAPVVRNPGPMQLNSIGEEVSGGFYLGGAERADTVIDFSQYAGKTLILYNDSTAPVPGGDTRYDYYTGDPDQTTTGGAPSTLPGYGPNTRTVMQIVVGPALTSTQLAALDYPTTTAGAKTGTRAFDTSVLRTQLSNAYTAVADTHVVGALASAVDQNLGALPLSVDPATSKMTLADGTQVDLQIKTIHGFTDPNIGRLIAQIGTELPGAAGVPTPLGYIDSPTDIIQSGDTQYWWIKNYDVDNHPMHFHLFNVQVLAHRVIATGRLRAPEEDEMGWKETVKNWPGEDVIVALKPKTPQLPFGLPKSVRALDPTLTAGATTNDVLYGTAAHGTTTNDYPGVSSTAAAKNQVTTTVPFAFAQIDLDPFQRDSSGNFVIGTDGKLVNNTNYGTPLASSLPPISNTTADFGWEYVWHCHILGHEENDLMRPMVYIPVVTKSATGPSNVAVDTTGNVTWIDPTPATDPATKGNTENEIGFRVERAKVTTDSGKTPVGTFTVLTAASPVVDSRVNTLANDTSFKDVPPAANTDYQYKVVSVNEAGEVAATFNLAQVPADPAILGVSAAGVVTWTDKSSNETGFRVERAPVTTATTTGTTPTVTSTVGTFVPVTVTAANAAQFSDPTLIQTPNADYQYRVVALNASVTPLLESNPSAATTTLVQLPTAPTGVQVEATTGVVNWTDASTNETSFRIERAPVTTVAGVLTPGTWVPLGSVLAGITTFTGGPAIAGTENWDYRVFAVNSKGDSLPSAISAVTTTPQPVTSAVSVTSAGLVSWSPNSNARYTGFSILRSPVVNGVATGFTQVGTAPAGATTYQDSTAALAPYTDYQYEVVVVNGALSSTPSAPATLYQAPAAPTFLAVAATPAVTATTLTLQWNDNATNDEGYLIEAAINGSTTYATFATVPANATLAAGALATYAATVTPGTTYNFRISAIKTMAAGYVPTYNTTTVATTTPATLVAPVVTFSSALSTSGTPQVTVNWANTGSTGQNGYTVERCAGTTATCGAATANWVLLTTGTGIGGASGTYLDQTPAAGVTYVYRVKLLFTAIGATTPTTVGVVGLSAQVTSAIAVAQPTGLAATSPTGSGITLTWTDTSTNETSFQVFRGTQGAAPALLASVTRTTALKAATGGAVTYADATAVAGTTYTYYVVAVNTTGTTVSSSLPSASVSFSLAMPAPTGLAAVQSGANIAVSWIDTSAAETSFEVLRTDLTPVPLGGTAPAPVTYVVARTAAQATALNGTVTYNDIAALPGVSYSYQVRAVNAPVAVPPVAPTVSAYAGPVTASVVIPAPTQLVVTVPVAGAAAGVTLNWLDNATFETAYRIDRAVVAVNTTGAITGFAPGVTAYATIFTMLRTGNVVRTTGAVSYTDATAATALPAGQAYAYQVYAIAGTAVSAPSNVDTSFAPVANTGAPTALTATSTNGTSLVLSWLDNTTTETSFLVTRVDVAAKAAADAAIVVGTVGAVAYVPTTFTVARSTTQATSVGTKVSYTDATALVGTTYTYTVAAITPTNPAPGLVSTPLTTGLALNAPTSATVAATATGITVGWTDASNNETGFKIVRNVAALDANGAPVLTNGLPTIATGSVALNIAVTSTTTQKTATGTVRTYVDTTALPGVTYFYTVAATAGTVAAPVTSTAAYTVPTSVIAPALNPPSNPTAAITNATRITLSWTDLSNNETGFLVERLFTPAVLPAGWTGPVWTALPVPAAGGVAPTVTVTRTATQKTGVNTGVSYADNLVAATAQGTYQYRVSAVNTSGAAPTVVNVYSAPATMPNLLDFTVPLAPTWTTIANPSVGVVSLNWADNSLNETGFTVQRATNATFTTGLVSTTVPGANATSSVAYSLNGVTAGTYYFRVQATNAVGASAWTTFGTTAGTVVTPTAVPVK